MPYDAVAVANQFLTLAKRDGKSLNLIKLQKLVYYAHGLCLAALGQSLINEPIEAWPYGPVSPSIYHEFKQYGSGPIPQLGTYLTFSNNSPVLKTPSIDDGPDVTLNEEVKMLIDTVWEAYGRYSAVQLSNLTHMPGTPWSQIHSVNPDRRGVDIPDEVMKAWFASQR